MVKISGLPPMASPDSADPAPVVDDSASTTKKLTLGQLKTWLQSLTGWITAAMMDAGAVVQYGGVEYSNVATGTTVTPFDDTIPQSTEGDQYMSLAFTPKFANSKLLITVTAWYSHTNANGQNTVALFRDSGANAIGASEHYENTGTAVVNNTFTKEVSAGSTAATTFKVRIGSQNAGTTTFNGQSGGRRYGGAAVSSIRIMEIKQ